MHNSFPVSYTHLQQATISLGNSSIQIRMVDAGFYTSWIKSGIYHAYLYAAVSKADEMCIRDRSVVVPFVVPLTKIFAPIIGSPVSSNTVPVSYTHLFINDMVAL